MPNALIWGASGGMGQALVQQLKDNGWQVFAAARNSFKVPDVADGIFEFNAADEFTFQQVMRLVGQEVEQLDLVVYTAGGLAYEKLDRMETDGWQATMDSNLNGAFYAANNSLPLMPKGTHMVFIGIYASHIRLPKMGAYAVAKAGLDELVTLLAKENRRHNFTIVRPGAVDTDFWEQVAFSKPDDIKSPDVVATAIIEHIAEDKSGALEL